MTNTTESVYDGYAQYSFSPHGSDPTYTIVDNTVINVLYSYLGNETTGNDGFIDFVPSLPVGATVTKVELIITTGAISKYDEAYSLLVDIKRMTALASSYSASNLMAAIFYNTAYLANQDLTTLQQYTLDLGSGAVTDLNAHKTWFSLGIRLTNLINESIDFKSRNDATPVNRPQLKVTYTDAGGSPTGGVAYSGGGGFIF